MSREQLIAELLRMQSRAVVLQFENAKARSSKAKLEFQLDQLKRLISGAIISLCVSSCLMMVTICITR